MASFDRNYNEKRDFIRMKINSEVTISQAGDKHSGICRDLSGAGMSVETDYAFSTGSKLDVAIEQKGDTHLPFHASAEVTRVDEIEEGKFLIGLSILEIQ